MSEQNHEERIAALEEQMSAQDKIIDGLRETISGLAKLAEGQIVIVGSMNNHAGIASMDLIGLIASVSNELLAVKKYLAQTASLPAELKQELLTSIARHESFAEKVEYMLVEARAKIANRPPLSGPDGGTPPPP